MTETPLQEPELPPSLRFLKRLVTVLTITMILGVITVVAVLVTKLQQIAPVPTLMATGLPAGITLPEGTAPISAVTLGTGWVALVTTDNHILIFSSDGDLLQDIEVTVKPK